MEAKDEIKARLDIVDLIGGYLTLKSAGSASFKAICPFHAEKSPSFHISRDKQIWHCFGCAKGGDIFAFVMEMEGMNFPEALRHLGDKAGVKIPEFTPRVVNNESASLYELNDLACKFYETIFWKHAEGEVARNYARTRNITDDLIKEFRLGASPARWDALTSFLRSRGYTDDHLVKAGLAKPRTQGGGVIDRFRNRLMIPLSDSQGRVVGFTARALAADEQGPKYLNSPETALYHKSDVLYGLHLAKAAIRQTGRVILMEGNLDVIASHKAGVKNVVAASGTALTDSQLTTLKKLCSTVVFSFDADNAGFNAAHKGIRLAQDKGLAVYVVSIPPEFGKDPDEVVQKNPAAWVKIAEAPVPILEYYFTHALKVWDPSKVDGKREIAKFITIEVSRLKEPIEREHWLQNLSDVIHVELDILRGMIKTGAPVVVAAVPASTQAPAPKSTKADQTASFIVGLLVTDSESTSYIFDHLKPDQLPSPWDDLYKRASAIYTANQTPGSTPTILTRLLDRLLQEGQEALYSRLHECALTVEQITDELTPPQVRDELNRQIASIAKLAYEAKRKTLESAIRQAELVGDHERLHLLMTEYSKFIAPA